MIISTYHEFNWGHMTTDLATVPELRESLELSGRNREAAEAVASGLRDAKAENTRRSYASAWRRFQAWADAGGHPALPATPRQWLSTWATWRRPPWSPRWTAPWPCCWRRADPLTTGTVRELAKPTPLTGAGDSVCPDAGPEGLRLPAGGGGLMTDTSGHTGAGFGELCHQFRLPTMGAQSVSRFTAAGPRRCPGDSPGSAGVGGRGPQAAAASAGCAPPLGCRQARPGRPSSTTGCPWRCDGNWTSWPSGGFVDRGVNVLAFGLPGTGKTHALCAVGHRLVEVWAGRCSSPRPTDWCRICWPPSGTWPCRDNYGSSTATTSCCSTTWATCPRAPRG